jgi:TPR repeat protein
VLDIGVPDGTANQHLIAAINWFQRAAEQGDSQSQFDLGLEYDSDRVIKQDYADAMRSYRNAADQGLAIAQLERWRRIRADVSSVATPGCSRYLR